MKLVSSAPPRFGEKEAARFALEAYGVDGEAKALVGDIGQNFRIRSAAGDFILKIANPAESSHQLEAQCLVLEHLATRRLGFACPRAVADRDGKSISRIEDVRGGGFDARLLTYVPGSFLAEIPEQGDGLLESIGRSMGELDAALADFEHPAAHRRWHWDLLHLSEMQDHLGGIASAADRNLVDHFLLQFETFVQPRLPGLRRSVIHNDANDHNLLVAGSGASARISGLIDFGDMVHSCTVFEPAVACAYAMLDKSDPLAAANAVVRGYHGAHPLEERELELLYWLVAGRLCLSVTIAAYQRSLRPDDAYLGVSEKPAWDALRFLFRTSPELAEDGFRGSCGLAGRSAGMPTERVKELRGEHMGPSLGLSYEEPLHVVRGAGQYLFDEAGRRYLDCVNNVCHVGHSHPAVVRALREQAAVLNTNTRYLHATRAEYLAELSARMPGPLSVCYLVNSGSEANELALRLAAAHTGREEHLVLEHGYHGNSSTLIGLSHYKFAGKGGRGPARNTWTLPMPDPYFGPVRGRGPEVAERHAELAEGVLDRMRRENRLPSAFLVESLPGCGGQIVFPDGYLARMFDRVRELGGVCIADEVQVGCGRVGSRFSAFETQGVMPDIVTLGKPIGNGHPLGAVICRPEIARSFANGMEYFNTFGGNPVSCAVGLAVLRTIDSEGLRERASRVGERLLAGLRGLTRHPLVGDVRGLGLFLGVELVEDRESRRPAAAATYRVVEAMKSRGVLLSVDGPRENVIKIKPPIVFAEADADELVARLDEVLAETN